MIDEIKKTPPMSADSFAHLVQTILLSLPYNLSSHYSNKIITSSEEIKEEQNKNFDANVSAEDIVKNSVEGYSNRLSAFSYTEGSVAQTLKTLSVFCIETLPPNTDKIPVMEGIYEELIKLSSYYLNRITISQEEERNAIRQYANFIADKLPNFVAAWLILWKNYETSYTLN